MPRCAPTCARRPSWAAPSCSAFSCPSSSSRARGQVYLPLLGYLSRVHRQGDAIALLLLYNLCFIAPLLVVFAASYLG